MAEIPTKMTLTMINENKSHPSFCSFLEFASFPCCIWDACPLPPHLSPDLHSLWFPDLKALQSLHLTHSFIHLSPNDICDGQNRIRPCKGPYRNATFCGTWQILSLSRLYNYSPGDLEAAVSADWGMNRQVPELNGFLTTGPWDLLAHSNTKTTEAESQASRTQALWPEPDLRMPTAFA